MSGQPIGLRHRIQSAVAIYQAYRSGQFGDPEEDLAYHRRLCAIIREHLASSPSGLSMLEIGCGQLAKQVALFQAEGARITGIDMEEPTYHLSPRKFLRVGRTNGWERASKSLARHLLFDRQGMRGLDAAMPVPVSWKSLDVRVMDAATLDFPDASFDFIFSKAVFEHIADVEAATRELARVLRPDGVVYISTHLYPSLSGGHQLAWLRPDSQPSDRVPPWDHLRKNQFPVNTFLNKLRINDYRRIFGSTLEILEESVRTEGAGLLTPDRLSELTEKGYTREDLLTRNLNIVAQRKR